MIVDVDRNPQNQIYYIGGLILNVLKQQNKVAFSYMDVFETLNEEHKVSINLYTLALDWLYLLGTISYTKKGLVKCF